jgi:hypothetical protein
MQVDPEREDHGNPQEGSPGRVASRQHRDQQRKRDEREHLRADMIGLWKRPDDGQDEQQIS